MSQCVLCAPETNRYCVEWKYVDDNGKTEIPFNANLADKLRGYMVDVQLYESEFFVNDGNKWMKMSLVEFLEEIQPEFTVSFSIPTRFDNITVMCKSCYKVFITREKEPTIYQLLHILRYQKLVPYYDFSRDHQKLLSKIRLREYLNGLIVNKSEMFDYLRAYVGYLNLTPPEIFEFRSLLPIGDDTLIKIYNFEEVSSILNPYQIDEIDGALISVGTLVMERLFESDSPVNKRYLELLLNSPYKFHTIELQLIRLRYPDIVFDEKQEYESTSYPCLENYDDIFTECTVENFEDNTIEKYGHDLEMIKRLIGLGSVRILKNVFLNWAILYHLDRKLYTAFLNFDTHLITVLNDPYINMFLDLLDDSPLLDKKEFYHCMKVPELKSLLRERNLKVSSRRQDLIDRLITHDTELCLI